jgi:hypothetical protein
VFASARWEARTASSTRDGVHVGSERRVEDVVGFVILKSGYDQRKGVMVVTYWIGSPSPFTNFPLTKLPSGIVVVPFQVALKV